MTKKWDHDKEHDHDTCPITEQDLFVDALVSYMNLGPTELPKPAKASRAKNAAPPKPPFHPSVPFDVRYYTGGFTIIENKYSYMVTVHSVTRKFSNLSDAGRWVWEKLFDLGAYKDLHANHKLFMRRVLEPEVFKRWQPQDELDDDHRKVKRMELLMLE